MKKVLLCLSLLFLTLSLSAQTTLQIHADSIRASSPNYEPGVFYVPKTQEAINDFLGNGIHYQTIRTHVIESALNNATNLIDARNILRSVDSDLLTLSNKCDKLLFVIAKMPPWLSSSSDGSPSTQVGWAVLHTKPPANYTDWKHAIAVLTDELVNNIGITNAEFEVWNEPDLGYWTGSEDEYFELFRETYDAVKSVDSTLPVGGPGVNGWPNLVTTQPPYGFVPDPVADQSLLGRLIDSSAVWNRPLSFISWHHFSLNHESQANAADYVTRKMQSLGLPPAELQISEWNCPSQARDTELHKAYMVKIQMEMAETAIDGNMIAAWQDFENMPAEFHNDYGLLTYGSIHKPAWYALQLTHRLQGDRLEVSESAPADVVAFVEGDSLRIMLTNYAMPPLVGALNHTTFTERVNATQLDSAGYINISQNDFTALENVYNGTTTLPGTDFVQVALNNSIPVYEYYDSLQSTPRTFTIEVPGFSGNYSGFTHLIDDVENNNQHWYDSLFAAGQTQTQAITTVTNGQALQSQPETLSGGTLSVTLAPNAVWLGTFAVPGLVGREELERSAPGWELYPNPADEVVRVRSHAGSLERVEVLDLSGKVLFSREAKGTELELKTDKLIPGVYLVRVYGEGGVGTRKLVVR